MNRCKVCGDELEIIMPFGEMPIANGFVSKPGDDEYLYELSFCFCPACLMVQLGETVKPEMLFNQNYAFFSSTSRFMELHFQEIATEILNILPPQNGFVVEIGCNDGIMLSHIADQGINHLGIEPAGNVAASARKNGVNVTDRFFNVSTAGDIAGHYGQADVICGANVMCHIEDINSVFEGVNLLLKDDGVFFFEDPYLTDIIGQTTFDQIYDEHVFYYCGLSVTELSKRHNLQIVDMVHQDVHGGSMRYYLKKGSGRKSTNRTERYIGLEKSAHLNRLRGYQDFSGRVDQICADLKNLLLKLKNDGARIVGYGATSKSTTLLNYADIGPDIIDYISDITPTKIGKYTPGTNIPVKSHNYFLQDRPPYTLLLAWNHRKEILAKEEDYRISGGKFVNFFPRLIIE